MTFQPCLIAFFLSAGLLSEVVCFRLSRELLSRGKTSKSDSYNKYQILYDAYMVPERHR